MHWLIYSMMIPNRVARRANLAQIIVHPKTNMRLSGDTGHRSLEILE